MQKKNSKIIPETRFLYGRRGNTRKVAPEPSVIPLSAGTHFGRVEAAAEETKEAVGEEKDVEKADVGECGERGGQQCDPVSTAADDDDDDDGVVVTERLMREQQAVRDEEPREEERMFLKDEEKGFIPAKEAQLGESVMRRRRGDGARWDPSGVRLLQHQKEALPPVQFSGQTPQLKRFDNWRSLMSDEEFEVYTMSIAPDAPQRVMQRPHSIVITKLRYLAQEILGDIGFHSTGSSEFWFTVVIYLMALWFRMYVHYLAQWAYLNACSIPVFDYQMQVHEIQFKYISTSIRTSTEMGLVMIGPLACVLFLVFLTAVGSTTLRFVGHIPDWFSKFSAASAVGSLLDPLLIFAIDVLARNFNCTSHSEECSADYTSSDCHCFEGDAFKLWARMQREVGSGVIGLIYLMIIYTGLNIIALGCAYVYFLNIHMNGRMLDVYRRIHSPSHRFFLPHDFEISGEELESICSEAKHWGGSSGEHRVITVCDYEYVDPLMSHYLLTSEHREMTTHVAIYTMSCDGLHTLWRHFLRTREGAIIEIVGDVSNVFASEASELSRLLDQRAEDGHSQEKQSKNGYFSVIDDL